MLATRAGYAGGELANPTYHHLGGHREAVEVTFDPRRISYRELLDEYWRSFPVSIPSGPSRTRTAVFPRGEEQRREAEVSKRRLRREIGERIPTEILAGAAFWPAERMHQKFHLQRVRPELVRELAAGDVGAFLVTTAAARLNAYVSGFAGEDALAAAARELGWDVDRLRRRKEQSGRAIIDVFGVSETSVSMPDGDAEIQAKLGTEVLANHPPIPYVITDTPQTEPADG